MMDINKVTGVDTYTDFKGLNALHFQAKNNASGAKKEVAEQFESLLVQMLMKSMREANQTFVADPESDEHAELYQDLLDKQLSMVIAHAGTGLSKVIEASMNQQPEAAHLEKPVMGLTALNPPVSTASQIPAIEMAISAPESSESKPSTKPFDSTSDFVKGLWSSAKEAAALLGTDPKFLLAQAALETNWGKSILSMVTGESTHNLFNIKAGSHWDAPTAQVNAIEYEDGIMVKNKSNFRAYDSYKDSFHDYVHFLKNNSRYEEALKHVSDPHQFAQQLQKANYATDEKYSDKIMQIYTSKRLNDLVAQQN